MVNSDLVKYFEDGVKSGSSIMQLRDSLINSGWSLNEVDAAMAIVRRDVKGSLLTKLGKGRIFLAFFIFILMIIIISLIAMGSEGVDVELTEADLLSGVTLDVGRDVIEFQYDEIKTETLRVIDVGVVSAMTMIGDEKVKFMQDENQTLDLDLDRKDDIIIGLLKVEDGSSVFYFELINKKPASVQEAESVDKEVLDKALAEKE